jgi:hypothetical protein
MMLAATAIARARSTARPGCEIEVVKLGGRTFVLLASVDAHRRRWLKLFRVISNDR